MAGLPATFNAASYLAANPDVAAAVRSGITTAEQHYTQYGYKEARRLTPGGQTEPLPGQAGRTAVGASKTSSGGYPSSRVAAPASEPQAVANQLPTLSPGQFNRSAYLAANPDVAAAGVDAYAHYLNFGINEGRSLGVAAKAYTAASSIGGPKSTLSMLGAVSTGASVLRLSTGTGGKLLTSLGEKALPGLFAPGKVIPAGNVPYLSPSQVSAAQPGTFAAGGSTLAGSVSAAGVGYTIGSLLGPQWGLKTEGASYGGAIGATGGYLAAPIIATAVSGAASGAAAGAIAGSVVPVVGTIAGAVIGTLIGGQFGKPNPHPASTGGVGFDATGKVSETVVKSKHIDDMYGAAVANEIGGFLTEAGNIGARFNAGSIHAGVDNGRAFVAMGEDLTNDAAKYARSFDAGNDRAASNAIAKAAVERINVDAITDPGLKEGLKNYQVGDKTTQEVLNDLRNMSRPAGNNGQSPPLRPLDKAAKSRVHNASKAAQEQMDAFLEKVRNKTVGKPATIKTGPKGLSFTDIPVTKKVLGSGLKSTTYIGV